MSFSASIDTGKPHDPKGAGFDLTVTCTPAPRVGTLKITKVTSGGTGTFNFTSTQGTVNGALQPFNTAGGSVTQTFTNIPVGTFDVTENDPSAAGFDLTAISCTDPSSNTTTSLGTRTATVNLAAAETVECTFTNTKQVAQVGTLKITKVTSGGTGTFNFTSTQGTVNGALQPFNTAGGSVTQTFTNIPVGTFDVTENDPSAAGFDLTAISCTDPSSNTTTSLGTRTATVNLAAAETVECTFTNTKRLARGGTITIIKQVTGPNKSFSFGGDLGAFSLSSGQSFQSGQLAAGTYNVSEMIDAAYTLASISCVGDTDNGTTTNTGTGLAAIDLDDGENIVCTYTNSRKTGNLTIEKNVIGGNGNFTFSVTGNADVVIPGGQNHTFTGLPTGIYVITEKSLPAGWTLKSISNCGQVDLNNKSVTVDLQTSATCTFTNFKDKDDTTEDETKRFINRRVDNLLTYGPDRARMLRRMQEQEPQQSLKDGPIKLAGEAGSGPMMLGRPMMGSSPMPGINIGLSSTAAAQATLGYTSPFKYDAVTYIDDADETVSPFNRAPTTSLFGQLAQQLMPLAAGDQSAFNFATSLSEIRAAAAAAEETKEREKLQAAGLSFADDAYAGRSATLRQGFDVWIEGHIAKYNDDIGGIGREGDFRILYVGADYVLAPGVLVGALVQIDDTKEDIDDPSLTGKIEGTGWMVGPYVGVRLFDDLFFDARAAWGRSSNDINLSDGVVGSRNGSFDTDRWLASASLTGNEYYGAWRFSPQISIAYGNESSDAYTTSLGQTVGSTDATIGRLTGTMEVGYRTHLENGTLIEPHVAISGIWNFDTDDLSLGGVVYNTDEVRPKIEGGLIIQTPDGLGLRWSASYDGLGSSDFDAVSGSLWVNVPLN